jgi:prophage regulatory protein
LLQVETLEGFVMRPSDSNASNGVHQFAPEQAAERAVKAAYLLREALALLGSESAIGTALTGKRESDRLLRLPEVQHLTGLRRSAIYEQMQRGIFPRSIKAGPRAATWSEAAVQAWISKRIDAGAARTVDLN